MMILDYNDIINKIKEFFCYGQEIHFLVRGYLAEDIVYYLDTETDLKQFVEDDMDIIEEYNNDEMYWVDVVPSQKQYYVQEAVYQPQGILAQNCEDDIVFYQSNTILSKENKERVLGKLFKFVFIDDMEDDVDLAEEDMVDECDTEDIDELEDDMFEEDEFYEEETLEDCNCNECLQKSVEHLYAIIDEFEDRLDKLENKLDTLENAKGVDVFEEMLEYMREYC